MSGVPVVRILPCEQYQAPGFEFVEINASDFDASKHKLFGADVDDDGPEGAKKASDGLTAPELKNALTAKGIEIPEGAKKADLQALLDAAQ